MVMETGIYSIFADLFTFPREDVKLKVEECINALSTVGGYPPEVIEDLKRFRKELEDITLDDLQGVYSYTFELTSDYTLDLGYHLFDGFKRANNLSSIKSMYREKGFPYEEAAKGELPDNFPVILKFLDFLDDEELKKDFRESFVILAVEKMAKNFERNKRNIYSHLVNAVYRVLEKDVKEGS